MVAFHTALGDPQTLTAPEKTQALGNIGAMGVGFAGATGTIPDARLPTRLFTSTEVTDFNDAVLTGVYWGNGATNAPTPGAWVKCFVEGFNNGSVYAKQTACVFVGAIGSTDTQTWQRSAEAGVWGAWFRLRISQDELDARYLVKANAVVQSYTVATLPTPGTAGRIAWASDCRVFNGIGTQEGAAAGTGGLVTDNGTAWKIAGTNITAVA